VFYWPDQERQVCVPANCSLPVAESEAYFRSRPRDSRLAAWRPNKARLWRDRGELEAQWKDLESRYAQSEVPRPPYWEAMCSNPIESSLAMAAQTGSTIASVTLDKPNDTWVIERLSP